MWTACCLCARPGAPLCSPCRSELAIAGAPRGERGAADPLAAFRYEGPARRMILGLKLGARRDRAGPLAEGIARAVHRHGLLADVVTWVPGRRSDIRQRGFDHAEVIARGVARRLGLEPRALLVRVASPEDQTGLARSDRLRNVQGAFRALPAPGAVALVDDLFTTGATAKACCDALAAAGAGSLEVLAAARA